MTGKEKRKGILDRVLAAFLLLLVLTGFFLTAYLVRMNTISVDGDLHYDSSEVVRRIFPEAHPRLLSVVREKYFMPASKRRVFDKIRVRIPSLTSCVIEITEKEPAAVFSEEDGDTDFLLSEDGVLLYLEPKDIYRGSELIRIEGLEFRSYEVFRIPETEQPEEAAKAVLIAEGIRKREIPCSVFRYKEGAYFLDFGDVKVAFGPADNTDAKLDAVRDQYPYYAGLKGVLHMEKYSREAEGSSFYFSVEP